MMVLSSKGHKQNKIGSGDRQSLPIVGKWDKAKQKLADYLQRKSELLSMRSKKSSLAFFCIAFSAVSTMIMFNVFEINKSVVKVKTISRLSHAPEGGQLPAKTDSLITKYEYNRVELFKNYLLHLKNDSTSKAMFDSIVKARPNLFDSIALFEKMYLSQ